ncbi:MAG TPA: hypothetical protein DCQ98_10410, partial [Planctomycetaceae bacterium]|nr:hypothetical protein [Planctomycetaceae bacterium]
MTVANASLLNFESQTSHVITVRVTDTSGATYDEQFTVAVTNANEGPADLTFGSAPTGLTTVGSASQVDSTTYQLTPNVTNAGGAVWGAIDLSRDFTITSQAYFGANDSGADGLAFVLQNQGNNVTGGVAASLGAGLSSAFGVAFDTHYNSVHSNNINSDFIQFFKQGQVSNQGTAFDSPIAVSNLEDGQWRDLVVTWDASTNTLSYSLDGLNVGSKSYDVVGLDWGGNTAGWFGFSAGTGGSSNQQQIRILNVETDNQVTLAENAASGTVVGVAAAIDPDRTDSATYQLLGDADGRFVIDSATGVVTVATGASLDFEDQSIHTLTVRATDSSGATYDESFSVVLTDVNEGPVAVNDTATAAEAGGVANA